MNHVDIEFQYSALFLSERFLHKIVLFKKEKNIIWDYNQEVYSFINISYL